jgi:hypothetical protein
MTGRIVRSNSLFCKSPRLDRPSHGRRGRSFSPESISNFLFIPINNSLFIILVFLDSYLFPYFLRFNFLFLRAHIFSFLLFRYFHFTIIALIFSSFVFKHFCFVFKSIISILPFFWFLYSFNQLHFFEPNPNQARAMDGARV